MRSPFHEFRSITLTAAMIVAAGTAAYAHHGWSWTQDGVFELKGTITAIYIGNPHATLDVDAEGEAWRVEMAPPSRTIAAGFTEDVAADAGMLSASADGSRRPWREPSGDAHLERSMSGTLLAATSGWRFSALPCWQGRCLPPSRFC